MNYRLEDFTPTSMLMKVQGIKYKAAIFPVALVLLGFLVYSYFQNDYVKFTSMLGLFIYLGIIYIHRVYRPMPPQEHGICLSPVHGTVTLIEANKITIEKKFFNYIDLRIPVEGMELLAENPMIFAFEGQGITCEITGNRLKNFHDETKSQGRIAGVAVGKCTATITLPEGWKVEAEPGEKVIAGESVIGGRI